MSKFSQSSSLSASRNIRDQDPPNKGIPSQQQPTKSVNDPTPKILSLKQNPLDKQISQFTPLSGHKRIKSTYEPVKSQITLDKHLRKVDMPHSPIKISHSPLQSTHSPMQPSHSPSFRRVEQLKIIDSYENRLGVLSRENGALQNQVFQEQQRHNQALVECQLQIKQMEQRMQTEVKAIQQQKLLLASKNEEIGMQNQEIDNLERRVKDLEHNNAQYQKETLHQRSQLDNKQREIDQLRDLLLENEHKTILEIEDIKIQYEQTSRQQYDQQLKDMQKQTQQHLQKLDEQYKQDQQKQLRLSGQNEQLQHEISSLQHSLQENKVERERLLEEVCRTGRQLEDSRNINGDLLREIEILKERIVLLDKGHQSSLEDMKSHYDYMRKSQTEREVKEVSMKFQSEKMALESQIRGLNLRIGDLESRLADRGEENKGLQLRLVQLDMEYKNYIQEYEHYKRLKLGEQEDMQMEIQRTKQQLLDVQNRLQNSESEVSKLNSLILEYRNEMDITRSRALEVEQSLKVHYESDIAELMGKHQKDRSLLDEHIQELKYKVTNLENMNRQKDEQIAQYQLTINLKATELETLKKKLKQSEESKAMELKDYQDELELFKKDMKESNQKLLNERNGIENQLKSAKQKLNEQEAQLLELQFQVDQSKKEYDEELRNRELLQQKLINEKHSLEQQLNTLKDKYNQCEVMIVEYKESINNYIREIDELNEQNESDRAQHVQQQLQLESKYQQLKQQLVSYESDMSQTNQIIEQQNSKIDDLENRLQRMQDEFKRREQQYVQEITNLKQDMENSVQEKAEVESQHIEYREQIDQLEQQLITYQRELDGWQSKYNEMEEDYNQQLDDMTTKVEYYQKFELNQQDMQIKFEAEKSAYETRINQLEQQIDQLEGRVQQLTRENRSLEDLMETKVREIENLKQQLNQNFVSNEEYDILKQKNTQLKDEVYTLEQMKIKFNTEKSSLSKQIVKLEDDLEIKDQEVKQAHDLMNKRRSESDEQTRKIEQLNRDNQRLQHDVQEGANQYQTKQEAVNALRRENEDLTSQLQGLRRQLQQSQDQLSNKSKELQDKINEIDSIKQKYEEQWRNQPVTSSQLLTTSKISITRASAVQRDSFLPNPLNDDMGGSQFTQTKSQRPSTRNLQQE